MPVIDLEVLNGLIHSGSPLEVKMIIDLVDVLIAEEVALQLQSSTVDVVLVHCQRPTCLDIVKEV